MPQHDHVLIFLIILHGHDSLVQISGLQELHPGFALISPALIFIAALSLVGSFRVSQQES